MRGFAGLLCAVTVVVSAQDYRGEAVPRNTPAPRATAISFSRFRLQSFAFGREGPTYVALRAAPVAGREYFAEADVYGIEGVASLRFEITDAAGRALQTLTFWKSTDSSTDGEFFGFVTVPAQSFRVAAVGAALNGTPFRSLIPGAIQTVPSGPEDQLVLPQSYPADEIARARQFVEMFRQEMIARAAQAAREHPGGVISLARPGLSRVAYEPYSSPSNGPLGMRLRYSIRFDADAVVVAVPNVFPAYQATDWRGLVTMKPLGGTINPLPTLFGATSLTDVIVYRGGAQYKAGTTYTFSIDLIPDYVFQGAVSGRFCLHDQKFASNPARWNALITSTAPVRYSMAISDLDYAADIPLFYPQSLLRANFLAVGAFDCGPVPNIRF